MAPRKRSRLDEEDDEVVATESTTSSFRNDSVRLQLHNSLLD